MQCKQTGGSDVCSANRQEVTIFALHKYRRCIAAMYALHRQKIVMCQLHTYSHTAGTL